MSVRCLSSQIGCFLVYWILVHIVISIILGIVYLPDGWNATERVPEIRQQKRIPTLIITTVLTYIATSYDFLKLYVLKILATIKAYAISYDPIASPM